MAVNVSLDGYDHIMTKIQEMGKKAGLVENEALRAGAKILQKSASEKAPRSSSPRQPYGKANQWRTGEHLAENIEITAVKMDENGKYIEVGPTPGDNSPFFYGKFLEWGTSKMAAEPFMGPAEVESKGEVMNTIAETLKRGLDL